MKIKRIHLLTAVYKVYPYRWIILAIFMLVVCINQLLWITFAPITGMAAEFYHVSDLRIGLLSMIFMVVYIVVSVPAPFHSHQFSPLQSLNPTYPNRNEGFPLSRSHVSI